MSMCFNENEWAIFDRVSEAKSLSGNLGDLALYDRWLDLHEIR